MSRPKYADEGYIKFRCDLRAGPPPKHPMMKELKYWRDKMHQKNWIGFDKKLEVGFGNISISDQDGFIISGTQTGHIQCIQDKHFTSVTGYDIYKNCVRCTGMLKASSETLTHAIIYEQHYDIYAIIHIHSNDMWEKLLHTVPTSASNVRYGTPEMALEVQRLYTESALPQKRIMVMAGHQDGIIAFGKTLKEAAEVLLNY